MNADGEMEVIISVQGDDTVVEYADKGVEVYVVDLDVLEENLVEDGDLDEEAAAFVAEKFDVTNLEHVRLYVAEKYDDLATLLGWEFDLEGDDPDGSDLEGERLEDEEIDNED